MYINVLMKALLKVLLKAFAALGLEMSRSSLAWHQRATGGRHGSEARRLLRKSATKCVTGGDHEALVLDNLCNIC